MGRMIGDGVNAALGAIDYSRWAESAERSAEARGRAISDALKLVGDHFEGRRKKEEAIQISDATLAAFEQAGADRNGTLAGLRATLADESRGLNDRAAIANVSPGLIDAFLKMDEIDQSRKLDERRLGIEQSRFDEGVRQFNLGRTDATDLARAKQQAEGQESLLKALGRYVVGQEESAHGSNVRPMPQSLGFIEGLMKRGQGGAALSMLDAYDAAQNRHRESNKPPTLKPMKLGGTGPNGEPLEIDAFVSPDGFLYDTNRRPLNGGEAWGDGSGGQSLPSESAGLSRMLPPALAPYAAPFEEAGQRHGIDPRFLAAISMHETANGTSSAFKSKNNAMGISDTKGPTMQKSVEDSIYAMAHSLARPGGHYEGANTIGEIGSVYAPRGAGNDPRGLNQYWPGKVAEYYQALGGNPSASVRTTPAQTDEQRIGAFIERFMPNGQGGNAARSFGQGTPATDAALVGSFLEKYAAEYLSPPAARSPQGARRIPPMPTPQFGVRPLVSPKQSAAEAQAIRRAESGDKRLETTLEQANTLAGSLDNLRQTTALLDKVRTGFGADSITAAKRVLGADVANEEQLQTLLGDQVMARVGQTKGAVSEKEMELFQKFSANFGKTTEGNRKIVEFATKAAERAKVIASTIQDGFAEGKTSFQIEKEISAIRDANPIAGSLTAPPAAPKGIPVDEDAENAWLGKKPIR